METRLHHPDEASSNEARDLAARFEPKALRTYTPTQAVLARSAGIYHWTPEGRRLFDFTSGVLVSNLGHNPQRWTQRFLRYLGWPVPGEPLPNGQAAPTGYFFAAPLTAYNAITEVEIEATRRLIGMIRSRPGSKRLEQVLWAASGSE